MSPCSSITSRAASAALRLALREFGIFNNNSVRYRNVHLSGMAGGWGYGGGAQRTPQGKYIYLSLGGGSFDLGKILR